MTERWVIGALRVFLVGLFTLLVVFQTLSMPGQFRHMAEQSPEDASLRWPLTAIAIFLILSMQVVIVATWKLLTRVKDDSIFSEPSLRWVDAIVWAMTAAWAVLVGVFAYVVSRADDPGAPMLLLLVLSVVTVLGLLVVVLRALLREAIALNSVTEFSNGCAARDSNPEPAD